MSKRTVCVLNNANNQRKKTGFIVCFGDILAVSRSDSLCLIVARVTPPDSPRAEKRAKKVPPSSWGIILILSFFSRFGILPSTSLSLQYSLW